MSYRSTKLLSGLALVAVTSLVPVAAAVYEADSPEPTPEEVIILELMNRFRADPVGEADRLSVNGGIPPSIAWSRVDWQMFLSEMRALKPVPPLVFDLEALKAARRHSYYMIHNGLGHVEQKGKEGFTAESFGQRMKIAGFQGGPSGENAFKDAPSPSASHLGFVVDYGKGGPGGMQPGRGHRKNMISGGSNVVGPGAVPHGSRLSVTHNFGRKKGRFAGGVIYTDKNRNGVYDIGEGRGGITVATADGKNKVTTWSSGAYTLPLSGNGAVSIVAGSGDFSFKQDYPEGKGNVKFDWVIPLQADLDAADTLLAGISDPEGDPAEDKKLFKQLVELYIKTRPLSLDPDRAAKVEALAGKVGPDLEAAQTAVTAALKANDPKALKDALKDPKRTYRGTEAELWFKEAEVLGKASVAVANLEKLAAQSAKSYKKSDVRKLKLSLEKTGEQITTIAFQQEFKALASAVSKYQ